MANVGVIGAGSWGTALSVLLHDNGHQVTIWSIDPEEVKMLAEEREHKKKLPGVKLSEDMVITGNLEAAVHEKDVLVLAVPSPFTRATAKKMAPYIMEGQIIVDVAKGIEEDTLLTLSEQIRQEIPQADVAVLSEPCGGSGKKTSDNLCDRRIHAKDRGISAGIVYQQGVPCLYKSGHSWNRTGRLPEKCDRACSGNRRRTRLRR